ILFCFVHRSDRARRRRYQGFSRNLQGAVPGRTCAHLHANSAGALRSCARERRIYFKRTSKRIRRRKSAFPGTPFLYACGDADPFADLAMAIRAYRTTKELDAQIYYSDTGLDGSIVPIRQTVRYRSARPENMNSPSDTAAEPRAVRPLYKIGAYVGAWIVGLFATNPDGGLWALAYMFPLGLAA